MSFRLLKNTWESLGASDPMWAILTDEDKRGGGWDPAEFFATGEKEIGEAMVDLARLAPNTCRGRVLDFGCGLGRLSQALAQHFEAVDGVDVASSMVEQARTLNRHEEKVRYHLNAAPDLALFPDQSFDLIYTTIVLQHMTKDLQEGYVREFARLLAPGGLALFQLTAHPAPTKHRGLIRRHAAAWRRRLFLLWNRRILGKAYMDMHGCPRQEVRGWLDDEGLQLLEDKQDDSAGPFWISYRYIARRPCP